MEPHCVKEKITKLLNPWFITITYPPIYIITTLFSNPNN